MLLLTAVLLVGTPQEVDTSIAGANGPSDPGNDYYVDYVDPWDLNPDWDYDCDDDIVFVVIRPSER